MKLGMSLNTVTTYRAYRSNVFDSLVFLNRNTLEVVLIVIKTC